MHMFFFYVHANLFLSQNFDGFFYKIFVRSGRLIYIDIKEM